MRSEVITAEGSFEIACQVSESVMGWPTFRTVEEMMKRGGPPDYPYACRGVRAGEFVLLLYERSDFVRRFNPAEDIKDAFEVVDCVCAQGQWFKLHYDFDDKYGAWAFFDTKGVADARPLYGSHGETPAIAICNAALNFVNNRTRYERIAEE